MLSDGTPLPVTLVPRTCVLVVDDEPSIRMMARLMLERAGYVAVEAADADEALRRLQESGRPVKVVVLDVSLPDRSGVEVIPDLRTLAPRTRVILTSGHAEEDFPGHGADAYLPKPFRNEELVAAVRAVTAATPR